MFVLPASMGLIKPPAGAPPSNRLTPNGDISDGSGPSQTAWTTSPLYSKVNQLVDYPSTPSTATYIENIWNGNSDACGIISLDLDTISGITTCTALDFYAYVYLTTGKANVVFQANYAVSGAYPGGSFFTSLQQSGNLTQNTWQWVNLTFSGLSLSQSDINNLSMAFAGAEDNAGSNTLRVCDAYFIPTYT